MASLQLKHIYKVYDNGVKAVNDFCMDIADKEFIVFVGPSGCGKSTTLRMIAGLEDITAGELRIGDVVVNDVEPKDRDIAMVFQNYALYPHMTVYENMAFGLRLRKVPKDVIDSKVKEAAAILGITDYLDRKPKEMSGGQRQRVALGRAIVREPKVFLLDEPLSNLDAKLRTAMRAEISKLHHKLQTTFIYVTHDQVEAMTMGTRIVVMKDGFVQQIDTPRNLYRFPGNKFVAGFIGTPQMNFFNCKLLLAGDVVTVSMDDTDVKIDVPVDVFKKTSRAYLDGQRPVVLGIRAEDISVDVNRYPYKATCRVSHIEELGTDCQVYADFAVNSEETVAESPTRVILKAPAGSYYEVGQLIDVSLDMTRIHLFDTETELSIAPRIPQVIDTVGTVDGKILSLLGVKLDIPEAVSVDNGSYDVLIPTSAITLGGNIKATVVDEENINGQRLVHLKLGDRILFALVDESAQIGKTVQISIDIKQITLAHGEEVVVAPLQVVNSLVAKLSKRKVVAEVEVNGKIKKSKKILYSLELAGASIQLDDEFVIRLFGSGGMEVLNHSLEVNFNAYQVKILADTNVKGNDDTATVADQLTAVENNETPSFVKAVVDEVLHYGKEVFLACSVDDKKVVVAIDSDKVDNYPVGSELKLQLNIDDISISDIERGLRLL